MIAVGGQRMRYEAVITGVVDRRVEDPVQAEHLELVIELDLIPRALGDLDDDVDNVGTSLSWSQVFEAHHKPPS